MRQPLSLVAVRVPTAKDLLPQVQYKPCIPPAGGLESRLSGVNSDGRP